MLTGDDLASAVRSIVNQIKIGGIFVASIRDYDALLQDKPPIPLPIFIKRSPVRGSLSRPGPGRAKTTG